MVIISVHKAQNALACVRQRNLWWQHYR